MVKYWLNLQPGFGLLLLLLVGNKDALVGRQGCAIMRPKKLQAKPNCEGDRHQRQQQRVLLLLLFGGCGRRRRPDEGTGTSRDTDAKYVMSIPCCSRSSVVCVVW